jgi:hypothetical protein
MVLPFALVAPKIIIPSFFIAHKVRGEKDSARIAFIIGFTLMFAATIIILFQDRMPWIALITAMSAVLFHQIIEGQQSQKEVIYALSLTIMLITYYGFGCSALAIMGTILYTASYFARNPITFTAGHIIGLIGFAYGVHDPSFLKEITAIGEHLS